jgi:hypothetical protein
MKKLILLFVAAGAGLTAMGQIRGGDNFYAQKYVIDLNFPVGVSIQNPTSKIDPNVYTNLASSNIDKLKMGAGSSYGVDAQFGYFIGKRRRFGIGAGIMYLSQQSDATLGAFRVEYQAYAKGAMYGDYTYRQIVTATHAIKETLKMTNINIPVVLKYKQRLTTKIGFTMDAGILYNVQMSNAWKTDGEFNYEAALKFDEKGAPVYDKAATPGTNDWLITAEMYERTHTANSTQYYFDTLHSRGYNVALGVKPNTNSGTISYTTGSIGFLLRPAINVKMTNRIHLNLGACFTYQSFNNKTMDNYKLIDNMGKNYSSLLNSVSSVTNTTIGLNVGLRYFIGEPKDKDFDGLYDE